MTPRLPNPMKLTGKTTARFSGRARNKRSILLPQFKERMVLPALIADRALKDSANPKPQVKT